MRSLVDMSCWVLNSLLAARILVVPDVRWWHDGRVDGGATEEVLGMPSTFPWKGRIVVVAAGLMLLLTVFAFRSFEAVYGSGVDAAWSGGEAPTAVVTDSQEAQGVGGEIEDPESTYSVVLRLAIAVITVLILADLVQRLNQRIEHRFGKHT
jgi:hypothetical protein